MPTIFSRIVAGEIPCYKIAEDEDYFAFLDINPLAKGHTLVIPKTEGDYIFDMSNDDYVGLTLFAKKVAKAIEKGYSMQTHWNCSHGVGSSTYTYPSYSY